MCIRDRCVGARFARVAPAARVCSSSSARRAREVTCSVGNNTVCGTQLLPTTATAASAAASTTAAD
eukprot:15114697-Alexandrium_andersonii.AAC.1